MSEPLVMPEGPSPTPGWVHWCPKFIPATLTPNACARCGRIKGWH